MNSRILGSINRNIMYTNLNKSAFKRTVRRIIGNYDLYLMFLPVLLYYIIFHYLPMYGVQIAFRDFSPVKGITGSEWVGLENLKSFFNSYNFWTLLKNTLGISLYSLGAGFPVPIILALMLNEVKNSSFKKLVQTITYAPHFISVVVMVGMILLFLSPSSGMVNSVLGILGGKPIDFMGKPELFKSLYVFSNIWQNAGWGAIIYLAVLAGIDPQLHESAIIDGAGKLKRIRYINLPGIAPTAVIMLILNAGHIMDVGFEKILLMQNPLNLETSEVISTYVYKMGVLQAQYSLTAAIGLFNNIINLVLLLTVNRLSRAVSQTSLW